MIARAPSIVLPALLLLGGCNGDDVDEKETASSLRVVPRTQGETRVEINPHDSGKVALRTGPKVPLDLPEGLTLYPGAEIEGNTLVTRNGRKRSLLEFRTPDPPADVLTFYHGQAKGAGMAAEIDLAGPGGGSLGGNLPDGRVWSVAVKSAGKGSHAVVAID